MTTDALLITARKHRRLLDRFDGVIDVQDCELIKDIGWSVRITVTANAEGWNVMGFLLQNGADVLVESCEPVDYTTFTLRIGLLWEASEAFADALDEVFEVERWLRRHMATGKRS